MKQIVRSMWVVAAMLSSTTSARAAAEDTGAAATRALAVARAANLSGEIALGYAGGEVFDQAFGLADRERGRPHRSGARWLWASVTKQVTATLVMQQVEAGQIALDQPIRAYLPWFAGSSGDKVTIRHLLQHVSGLPNPNDTKPNAQDVQAFYTKTGAAIGDTARARGFCSGTPMAAPGAGFSYNNCDYLVLGAILEQVTGQSFAALVAERIAKPLGLRSLRMAADKAPRGGGAPIGYTTGGKRYPVINVATFGAAGALTGTARDLVRLDLALVQGKLLKDASRAILWSGDPKLGYEALGVWSFAAKLRGCVAPVALIERRGDVGGTQVRNVIAPALGRAIAVFTNDDSVDFGEVWQGKGLSFDLLSAAFCQAGG
ncbi:serine hydrolase domain-containing protein [Novosphingobium sp.]|uniref:serine hydrolase domain-containing protein n=1 Tax=Novosphingobium sp. TaxID=1874826 RepID=UPI0025FD3CCA|nr:serine hydrolase domain-containing protein [Novosphingobium sp.]